MHKYEICYMFRRQIVILKETKYKGISNQDIKLYVYNAKIVAGMWKLLTKCAWYILFFPLYILVAVDCCACGAFTTLPSYLQSYIYDGQQQLIANTFKIHEYGWHKFI